MKNAKMRHHFLSQRRLDFAKDTRGGYEVEAHGITTHYESVIGLGKCKVVEDDKEILEGLRLICEHCGFKNVPLDTCWGLSAVRIYRIELDSITGKRNLPGGE